MKNNILYILTGLPFSGKTTLSKELTRRFHFQNISTDDIMEEAGFWKKDNITQEDWDFAYSEAYKQLELALKDGINVIFDCANLPFKERENLRNIAKKNDTKAIVIYTKVTKDEIFERRNQNLISKARGDVDLEDLETAFDLFEEPTSAEYPIIFSSAENFDDWISKNIQI